MDLKKEWKKIKVGEYVRLKNGKIIKFNRFGKYRTHPYINGEYTTKENKSIIDTKRYHYKYDDIIKHSSNIIDLIEVGDYVNGWKVLSIVTTLDKPNEIGFKFLGFDNLLYDIDIKSICTREQFENIEYNLDN